MKKLNGTVTLSFLEEDNLQRMIFRIIPLSTKDGLIFQNRKASYPDCGSLRIIPDKREQSSFKERMREMGHLCCVQLYAEGKELTKVRQNRNYDPNQGEDNQYAIYSDVICGFEPDAVFEVFTEEQDTSQALTSSVLVQRGMVLYGPIEQGEPLSADNLKPFGNDNYLLQTVEYIDDSNRTFYWNPEAIITWRQRKKMMKQNNAVETIAIKENVLVEEPQTVPQEIQENVVPQEQIPIGEKLEILDIKLTNDEQISELNLPVSDQANRLQHREAVKVLPEIEIDKDYFRGTPIHETAKENDNDRKSSSTRYHVVEKQLLKKKSEQTPTSNNHRQIFNPLDNLKAAFQDVWAIPGLHDELFRLLIENADLMREIANSPQIMREARSAYTAAKAEMDEIEAKRLEMLIELDKVKVNYQHVKDKMLEEIMHKKMDEITRLEKQLTTLKAEKIELEDTLAQMGDQLQKNALEFIASKNTMLISSNGTEWTLSPTIGHYYQPQEIVEIVRAKMNAIGFMCNQDCITEFLLHLSLFDEIIVMGDTLCLAEIYVTKLILALSLGSVTVGPDALGSLHLISLLPENELRTPTIEVLKNDRPAIKAYGHKSIRIIEKCEREELALQPVLQVPTTNIAIRQDRIENKGMPISIETLHNFIKSSVPLSSKSESWLDRLIDVLKADEIPIVNEVTQTMRTFARIATPQLIGGFMEAADAMVMAWVVPILMNRPERRENTMKFISDLPRSRAKLQS